MLSNIVVLEKSLLMKHFSSKLIAWYELNKRDLPWRHTDNPYHIWVSEIMLQQTQAKTVIPYYERFITTLKDIQSLATADEETLLKLWEGLGYYSRVRNMQKAAIAIMTIHQGIFPDNYEDIIQFKGIGEYTAGAILSIAFNQPISALDGNVSRVISRFYAVKEDIALGKTKTMLNALNQQLVDQNNPAIYTQAIIELGATLCTKGKPDCINCPVNDGCMAYKQDLTREIPYKSKLKAKKTTRFITAIMMDENHHYLVSKVEENLLNGLYLLPQVEAESIQYAIESFESNGISVLNYEHLNPYKHIFTHLVWEMDAYLIRVKGQGRYQSILDFQSIPIATAHKQIIIKEGYYGNI